MESLDLSDLYSMRDADEDVEIIQETSNTMTETDPLPITPQSCCNQSSNESTISSILETNSTLTYFTNNSDPELSVELTDGIEEYEEYHVEHFYTSTPIANPASVHSDVKFLRACRLNSHEGQIKVMKEGMKKQSDLLNVLAQESVKHWEATRSQNEQINKSLISAENAFKEINKLRSDTAVEFSAVSKQLERLESIQNLNSERISSVETEQKNQKEETKLMNSNLRQSMKALEMAQAKILTKLSGKCNEACDAKLRRNETEVEVTIQQGQKSNPQMNAEKASKTNEVSSIRQVQNTEFQVGSPCVMVMNYNNPAVPNLRKNTHDGGRSSSIQKQQKVQGQSGQPRPTREIQIQSPLPSTVSASVPPAEPPTKKNKVDTAPVSSSIQPNSVMSPATSPIPVVKRVGDNRKLCCYCGKEFSSRYVQTHEERHCRVGRAKNSNKNTVSIVKAPAEVQTNNVLSQRVLRPRKKIGG